MKRKFWNWVRNENDESRTLFLNGEISDETWYGDEVTPKMFKEELQDGEGDITVWINSPGGDVFAAAQIYNMLMDYKGNVTVKIDGLAASAASVIAMAGTEVQMSPVAMMMIHNPATIAIGDSSEMKKAIDMLDEVKESIMNAYEIKTGLSRSRISHLMDAESWFNAKKAVELGFADEILFDKEKEENPEEKKEETSKADSSNKSNTSESKKDTTASTTNTSSNKNNTSSSKPSNSSNSSNSNSSKPAEHTHNWVAQYKTVNVPEKGHNEQVLVQAAYDEPTYGYEYHSFCNTCGLDLTANGINDAQHVKQHMLNGEGGSTTQKPVEVQTGTIHHEAVYETRYVVDSPATTKQELTGYKCSSCGKTKAN